MSANITDYFNKASNMSGTYPPVATVTAARSAGGPTLTCDDLDGWATDTPVHFSTFQVTASGDIDYTTQTDWKGIVVGNTITEMTRLAGAADSGNASGDKAELNPTIGWLNDLVTGLLVAHKQTGALKDNAVVESTITTGSVSTSKIADNAVTTAKINDGATTASKIDFTTLAGKTFTPQSFNTTKSVGGTFTDFDSYTIVNSGLYAINISFAGGATSTQYRSNARVMQNSNAILSVAGWSTEAWSGNQFTEGYNTMVLWLNAGDVIKSQGKNENWTGNLAIKMDIRQIY
ncbi:MAG: hypothetical protein K6G49_02000 [Candidatus Saccharibacteria bacterium]|nr:hypothetical protein [Candidatus Saccharibacteria bacterium]